MLKKQKLLDPIPPGEILLEEFLRPLEISHCIANADKCRHPTFDEGEPDSLSAYDR